MKINPIYNYNCICPTLKTKPAFTSLMRDVYYEESNEIKHRNFTLFFRDDIDWGHFSDKLIEKYKKADKVNVYCYACSDGSEPYSLAISLIAKLGYQKAQKFFPIIAKDYDPFVIEKANRGEIELSPADIGNIRNISKSPLGENFKLCPGNSDKDYFLDVKVNDKLRSTVVFEQADILKDIDNIRSDNTVLMFRNAWPYLSPKEQTNLVDKLGEKLGKNSALVVGSYDKDFVDNFEELLPKNLCATDLGNFYETKNYEPQKGRRHFGIF